MGKEFHWEGSSGIVGVAVRNCVKNLRQLLVIADRVLPQHSYVMNLTQSQCLNSHPVIQLAL